MIAGEMSHFLPLAFSFLVGSAVALRAAREDFGRGVMVVARALFSKSVWKLITAMRLGRVGR